MPFREIEYKISRITRTSNQTEVVGNFNLCKFAEEIDEETNLPVEKLVRIKLVDFVFVLEGDAADVHKKIKEFIKEEYPHLKLLN